MQLSDGSASSPLPEHQGCKVCACPPPQNCLWRGEMTDTVTEAKLGGECIPGIAEKASPWSKAIRWIRRIDAYDIATVVLIAALVVISLCTLKDYAISNDEGVQHRYGELIIDYYSSGFRAEVVFSFQKQYLYGGQIDIAAIFFCHLIQIVPSEL